MQMVHTRYGAVAVSAGVIGQIKPMLMKLERGFFPTRGNGESVFGKLKELAERSPKEFSEKSLALFGISVD